MMATRSCAIMQPYFLPYIGYFQLINAVDVFVTYGGVNYIKKSWVTRNRMAGPHGEFYIRPVIIDASLSKTIAEIAIDPGDYWRRKLFSRIKQDYANAPYANETCDLLERIIYHQAPTLDAYNTYGIQQIVAHLGIETDILSTRDVPNTIEPHVRTTVDPSDRRQSRVTEICDAIGAGTYVNPASGQHLYDANHFSARNKKLFFIEPDLRAMVQQIETPRPDLSIAHCLMVSGKEKMRNVLACYTCHSATKNS